MDHQHAKEEHLSDVLAGASELLPSTGTQASAYCCIILLGGLLQMFAWSVVRPRSQRGLVVPESACRNASSQPAFPDPPALGKSRRWHSQAGNLGSGHTLESRTIAPPMSAARASMVAFSASVRGLASSEREPRKSAAASPTQSPT